MHLIDIIATIVCDCTCTQKWCLALRNGFNSQNAFVYIWGICYSKNIVKSRWSVHHRFGRHPQETGVQHHLCPPRSYTSGTLQSPIFGRMFILPIHCRMNQVESSEASQSRRWHGPNMAMRRVHMEPITWNPSPCTASCAAILWDLLHVTWPSQCPRVDEPHPASIARARPAVAGSARKGVAHAVRNSASVPDRYDWKFAQDTLNGNDIQDRFLVVKLV